MSIVPWRIQRRLLFLLPPEAAHRVVIWALRFNGWRRDLADRWEGRLDRKRDGRLPVENKDIGQ